MMFIREPMKVTPVAVGPSEGKFQLRETGFHWANHARFGMSVIWLSMPIPADNVRAEGSPAPVLRAGIRSILA